MSRFKGIPRLAFSLILLSVLFPSSKVLAQQFIWPAQPKNIKVLSKDLVGEKLRPIMFGFTRSLGVRCSYCHVGEEGKPITTYDFASDAKPNKDRAREMLRMLGTINDALAKIQPSGDKRVNLWCHTCHQGKPRPVTLEEDLSEVYRKSGVAAAVTRYKDLRERFYGRSAYDFGEERLNVFGYDLLGQGDTKGAIAIFRLNAAQFPASGNVWDSLAEGYQKSGNEDLARIYYRKALELDPDNKNALEKLHGLEKGAVRK